MKTIPVRFRVVSGRITTIATIVAMLLSAFPVQFFVASAAGTTIFSDGFENNDFSAWSSGNPDPGQWNINNSGHRGSKSAEVKGTTDSSLQDAVSTAGYNNLTLEYWYKIDKQLESSDYVVAQWWDGTQWNTLATTTGAAGDWTQASFTLPSGADDNANFKFRFHAVLNSANSDRVFLDDVSLTGDTAPATPECSGTDTVADTTFDTFALGNVNGQNNWSMTNSTYDAAVVANTYGYTSFGCKSLRLSDAKTSGSFGDWVLSAPVAMPAGESTVAANNHFEAQFDFASTKSSEQSGMQMSVAPTDAGGSRMSYLGFHDEADGTHVTFYDVTDAGPLGTTATFNGSDIATVPFGTAHTFKLTIDFVDGAGNDVVNVYEDGTLIHTGTSWEDYYRYDSEQAGNSNQLPSVDRLILQARGNGSSDNHAADNGSGYLFDNMILSAAKTATTGSIEIQKYACPANTTVTRTDNGVGKTVPQGCTPEQGATFGYVHGTQTDANGPYPELNGPITEAGTTTAGVLNIPNLDTSGRYLIVQTDGAGHQLDASKVLGLYCEGDGDTSGTNDNQELTFVRAGQTAHCVAYDPAPVTPPQPTICSVDIYSSATTTVAEDNNAPATVIYPFNAAWTASIPGASWIWGSKQVAATSTTIYNTFDRYFGWHGSVTNATLDVAADNTHTENLNGLATSSDLTQFNYKAGNEDHYNVAAAIKQGNNHLQFTVGNMPLAKSTWTNNPAGLLFKLHIEGTTTPGTTCLTPYVPPVLGCTDQSATNYNPDATKDDGSCTYNNSINVVATKIVCTDPHDMPNYGKGGPNITASTATDWLTGHASCHLQPDWSFQWGTNKSNPGDTLVGPANGWNTFGVTNGSGVATTSILMSAINNGTLWVREILKDGYIPFTYTSDPSNNTTPSAEIYCSTDVLNYDNYDRIDHPTAGNTYYCVAWNMPKENTPPVAQCTPGVNLIQNGSFETPALTNDWSLVNPVAWTSLDNSNNPVQMEIQKSVNPLWHATDGAQYAELAAATQTHLSQIVPTIPGAHYTLSWDFGPRPGTPQTDNQLAVAVNGTQVATNVGSGGTNENTAIDWQQNNTYAFTAASTSTTVGFAGTGSAPNLGTFLDKVSLTCQPAAHVGAYCGDGVVNQTWEQCDGGENCTDYCTFANQCTDLHLAKIDLTEAEPSTDFNGQIYLGTTTAYTPSGAWFNLDTVDHASSSQVALATQGLGVERTNGSLILAAAAPQSNGSNYENGTVTLLNATQNSIANPVVGWGLEEGDTFQGTATNTVDFSLTQNRSAEDMGDAASINYLTTVPACMNDGGNGGDGDPQLYRVQGYVFNDLNHDGRFDRDGAHRITPENPLSGWTVNISNGDTTESTTTDSAGHYAFIVPAGTWTITEIVHPEWSQTNGPHFTIVVPTAPVAMQTGLMHQLLSYLVPTAFAATNVIDVTQDYNFGNEQVSSTGGNHGGGYIQNFNGGPTPQVLGASTTVPNLPQVQGAQVGIIPVGAPNAGAGGTAPVGAYVTPIDRVNRRFRTHA